MIPQSFRIFHTITLAVVAIAASVGVLSAQRPASALTGRVTSEKEGPMEGVVVTARKDSDRVMGLNTSSREVTEYLLPSPHLPIECPN
jgi:hypothetical protein